MTTTTEPDRGHWPVTGPPAEREPELRRRFAAGGLRPAAGRCPRRVAGRRCLSTTGYGECICQQHQDALDHARCWRRRDGLVLTSEPYVIDAEQVTAYAADLAVLGLRLTLTGASPWFPGRTLLLMVTRIETLSTAATFLTKETP